MAGVLCAKREATGGVREAVRMSEKGVVWIMVEDLDEGVGTIEREEPARRGGRVKQILWNEKVAKMVGDNIGAGVRYVPGAGGRGMEKEVCLMVDGMVWVPEMGKVEQEDKI